jgi:hypothetical protein
VPGKAFFHAAAEHHRRLFRRPRLQWQS